MIGDPDLKVAKLYDMIHPNASGDAQRTAADNATVRSVFVVGPDKKIKLMLTYPMSTGRNFDEVLRVLDSMQLTAKHKVATPVNWKHGRRRDHRPFGFERRGEGKVPGRLEGAETVSADRAATEVGTVTRRRERARGPRLTGTLPGPWAKPTRLRSVRGESHGTRAPDTAKIESPRGFRREGFREIVGCETDQSTTLPAQRRPASPTPISSSVPGSGTPASCAWNVASFRA